MGIQSDNSTFPLGKDVEGRNKDEIVNERDLANFVFHLHTMVMRKMKADNTLFRL